MQVQILEAKSYIAKAGAQTISGLFLRETWNGLARYENDKYEYLLVDGDTVIRGSSELIEQLGLNTQSVGAPALHDGEHYAGIIFGKDGTPNHHLILLPGERTDINWTDALAWAASIGGDLPSRREQSLLFTNLKEQFQPKYHWSNEQYAAGASSAWDQHFSYGNQLNDRKTVEGCGQAVRRSIIS